MSSLSLHTTELFLMLWQKTRITITDNCIFVLRSQLALSFLAQSTSTRLTSTPAAWYWVGTVMGSHTYQHGADHVGTILLRYHKQ